MDFQNISPTVLWAVAGLALIVAEMFTATFFLLFFGIAGLIIAMARHFFGLDHLNTELSMFAAIGVAGVLIFRGKLLSSFQSKDKGAKIDEDRTLVLSDDVPAGSEAKVNYQGTQWTAINNTAEHMAKGTRVAIDHTDGIKIILKKI